MTKLTPVIQSFTKITSLERYDKYLIHLIHDVRDTILCVSACGPGAEFNPLIIYFRCDDNIELLFFESKKIFNQAITKLPSNTLFTNALLHAVLALLLQTASKFEGCSTAADPAKSAWISERLGKMWPELTESLFNEWIVKHYTPVFGGTNLRDCDKDIKVK